MANLLLLRCEESTKLVSDVTLHQQECGQRQRCVLMHVPASAGCHECYRRANDSGMTRTGGFLVVGGGCGGALEPCVVIILRVSL